MAVSGQRFEFDPDADDFVFNLAGSSRDDGGFRIKEIQEHDTSDLPPPPTLKPSKSGFPQHKSRRNASASKQNQDSKHDTGAALPNSSKPQPSDNAIRHQIGKKYGIDFESQQKAEISKENKQLLAAMSMADIEEAREELLSGLSPDLMEQLLRRANIDDVASQSDLAQTKADMKLQMPAGGYNKHFQDRPNGLPEQLVQDDGAMPSRDASLHFPVPPRSASEYKKLDPSSKTFLDDLRATYFPELSHNPSSLDWLQDPTPEDEQHSSYNPTLEEYETSSLRFDFTGLFIAPERALRVPTTAGLHHHGDAPSSAGYTIPELALLARSTMPSQRAIAYQTIGRVIFRLGQGEFGSKGSELNEAIWDVIEKERLLEIIMVEANQQVGHLTAKAYATEALWLWRRSGRELSNSESRPLASLPELVE